jgi:hypothetical protein
MGEAMSTLIEQANALTTPGDDHPELKALTELCRALAGRLGEAEGELEILSSRISRCLEYAGGRWSEWGNRAVVCENLLEFGTERDPYAPIIESARMVDDEQSAISAKGGDDD